MQITSGNKQITYGVTPGGNFFKFTQVGRRALMQATRNAGVFLKMMVNCNPDEDLELRMPHRFEHRCARYLEGFDSGHGQMMEGYKFCVTCLDEYGHFDFFRDRNMEDQAIYEISKQAVDL